MANLYGPNVLTPELVPLNQTSSGSPYDPRVAELQQMLNSQGYTDPQGKPLAVDGMMGPLTQYALGQKSASTAQGLSASPEAGITYLGGTRAPPSVPTLPSGGMATPSTLAGFSPQIGQMLSTLQGRATAPLPAPESTPQYVAAKDLLQREGTEASTRAVQQMASRGVLRSSMTEGALQRIEQEIVDRLTTQILPQVQQQLMAERQAELGGLRGDLQTAIDLGKFDISQLSAAQQAGTQAQQFGIEQAYRNAQLQQKAQEFAAGLQGEEADRVLRERLGIGNLNLGYGNLAERQSQLALARDRFVFDVQQSGKPPDYINKATQIMRGNKDYEDADAAGKQIILKDAADMLKQLYETPGSITAPTTPQKQTVLQRILNFFGGGQQTDGPLSDEEMKRLFGW